MNSLTNASYDAWQRRQAYYRLSLILASAFFLPITIPDGRGWRWVQPNIELLKVPDGPWQLMAVALFPLIASVALAVLTRFAPPAVRGIGVVLLSVAYYFLPLPLGELEGMAAVNISQQFPVVQGIITAGLLFLGGFLGLFVGARTLRYAGEYRTGAVIGALGLACIVGFCAIPIEIPFGRGIQVSMRIGAFFYELMKFSSSGSGMVSSVPFVWMIVTAFSGLFLVLALFTSSLEVERRATLSRWASGAFYASYGIPMLLLAQVALSHGSIFEGLGLLALLLTVVKALAWVVGILLIVPFGLADIAIALSQPHSRAQS